MMLRSKAPVCSFNGGCSIDSESDHLGCHGGQKLTGNSGWRLKGCANYFDLCLFEANGDGIGIA
jgi:hypothetical protein